jgi:two-component system, OmpR family, phosphate regulon sensor histidine kinase PhoR
VMPDGRVIADSDGDPATMENHAERPEVAAALQGRAGNDIRKSQTTGQATAYFARQIDLDGRVIAVLRAALPLSSVREAPAHIARLVAMAALLSFGLTLGLFYFVSRSLSRSVQRLADGAARFAAGDLSHRIVKPSSREMSALAEALNHMAERLNDQIEMLQAQRSEQQAIHQSMSNGMLALDLEQRILSVNRAAERLLGIDGAGVRGRLLQEVLREPELHRFVADSFSDDQRTVGEFQLRNAATPTVQAVSQPLRNPREQPVGLLVLLNDVTELRRLETIRSDFAANVSHELRTPITNIKGYVETMLDVGVHDQQQTRRFLEVINRNTARLASIIEDLLALARLEQPGTRGTLEKQRVAASRAVDACLAQFESEIAAKSMRIVTNLAPDLRVWANVQLLEQALGNLISNALKYSPAGTTITIHGERLPTGETALAVADEGPGIPEEHRARIFERFYRVDRARSREMGGTGLGLSIVKHIALVHGGSVTVQSEVGCGSLFRIVLPSR